MYLQTLKNRCTLNFLVFTDIMDSLSCLPNQVITKYVESNNNDSNMNTINTIIKN